MRNAILLLLLTLAALGVNAETRYVTDQFNIMMRTGESANHRILRQLPSGTAVKVLETNQDNGYSLVELPNGTTGYVLTRQLMDQPSARDRLDDMEARLRALQEEPDALAAKLTSLQSEYQALQEKQGRLERENTELSQELEGIRRTAANAVRIAEERNDLRKNVVALTRQVEELKQENRDLSHQTAQNWFLIGGGVVVLGILIGLILPHLRFQRRKSSWGSL